MTETCRTDHKDLELLRDEDGDPVTLFGHPVYVNPNRVTPRIQLISGNHGVGVMFTLDKDNGGPADD